MKLGSLWRDSENMQHGMRSGITLGNCSRTITKEWKYRLHSLGIYILSSSFILIEYSASKKHTLQMSFMFIAFTEIFTLVVNRKIDCPNTDPI